jgi:hypothetical protein
MIGINKSIDGFNRALRATPNAMPSFFIADGDMAKGGLLPP